MVPPIHGEVQPPAPADDSSRPATSHDPSGQHFGILGSRCPTVTARGHSRADAGDPHHYTTQPEQDHIVRLVHDLPDAGWAGPWRRSTPPRNHPAGSTDFHPSRSWPHGSHVRMLPAILVVSLFSGDPLYFVMNPRRCNVNGEAYSQPLRSWLGRTATKEQFVSKPPEPAAVPWTRPPEDCVGRRPACEYASVSRGLGLPEEGSNRTLTTPGIRVTSGFRSIPGHIDLAFLRGCAFHVKRTTPRDESLRHRRMQRPILFIERYIAIWLHLHIGKLLPSEPRGGARLTTHQPRGSPDRCRTPAVCPSTARHRDPAGRKPRPSHAHRTARITLHALPPRTHESSVSRFLTRHRLVAQHLKNYPYLST